MKHYIAPLLLLLVTVTAAKVDACMADVQRFCKGYVPNQEAVVACLQAHRAELSIPCRAVIRARK